MSCFETLLSLVDLLYSMSVYTLMDVDGFVAATADACKVLLGIAAVNHLGR